MLDGVARRLIDPALVRLAVMLDRRGISANAITVAGFAIGLAAAGLIMAGWTATALFVILLSRLCDGLDGAVARIKGSTDFGGYLDIVLDFGFYGAIPLAFAIADPSSNAIAAAVLLLSFYFNGGSFLAYAILAQKNGSTAQSSRGPKSFFFSTGLAEASETLIVFCAMCALPHYFPLLAWVFAAMCFWTAASRIMAAATGFGGGS